MFLLTDFILVFGFTVTLIILFMLVSSNRKHLPHYILIVLLLFIAITIINFYAELHELKSLYIITLLFESGERLLLGPLLYIYVKSLFLKQKDLLKNHLAHFIPFTLDWFFFTIPFAISEYREELLLDYLIPFYGKPYLALFMDSYLLVYICLSITWFYKIRKLIKHNYSNDKVNDIAWLQKFLYSVLGLMLFDFLITLYESIFEYFVPWDTGFITAVILIVLLVYLGYNGIKEVSISIPDFLLVGGLNTTTKDAVETSYQISEDELKKISGRLKEIMKKEKPYLSPELTLGNLAELVGTTNRKLSILLNQNQKVSFYDFINRYRIEDVKEKIQSRNYDNFSILGIAYDAGFKSKSSFYRAFKKETGLSPSDYKKHQSTER